MSFIPNRNQKLCFAPCNQETITSGLCGCHNILQIIREPIELPSTEHELKCWPEFFEKVLSGEKPFELRKNDRNFQVGDTLRLREWSPDTRQYTGREVRKAVTYILEGGQFGLEEGYCILGLR